MQKKIKTIAQLEKEKEKLKMTMTITRDALSKSLGTNRKELKDFMIKKVALPVGAVSLGAIAVKQLTKSKSVSAPKTKEANNALFSSLIPIAINLFQTYVLKKQSEKIDSKIIT